MKHSLILRPGAEEDVETAFRWYEEQAPGLGAEFLRAVEAALDLIERNPRLHREYHRRARRVLLRRFPYALFYVIQPDLVEVFACLHVRRHPRRWKSRL